MRILLTRVGRTLVQVAGYLAIAVAAYAVAMVLFFLLMLYLP